MPWMPIKLDPVTRKRLKRFRESRLAWWSFWILTGLYLLSLGAELLCNRNPLLVRFEKRWYCPVLRYYPEDAFLRNGRATRPDYKILQAAAAFSRDPGNRMFWPLLPYGPDEVLSPDTIPVDRSVRIRMERRREAGTVNMGRDGRIVRAEGAESFFDPALGPVETQLLADVWPLDDTTRAAIETRFDNLAAPALTVTVTNRSMPPTVAEISLATFTPRETPPATIRLMFRAVMAGESAADLAVVVPDGSIAVRASRLWGSLADGDRKALFECAQRRLSGPVEPLAFDADGATWRATFEREEVRWPFRPTRGHLLGIDNAGRDVLAQIIYGFRVSMTFGFALVACSMALGIIIGALQGFYGGALDLTFQRLIEIWSALPFLYVMILMGDVYGRSFLMLLICYGIFNWIGISYYMRGEFFRLRAQPFVEAAHCTGLSDRRIILRHILPNALVPVITFFPFMLVGAIGSLAALDFLGFGLPPSTPSWGALLQQAQQFRWAWWLILYPSLALFSVILLGVLVGEGVRQAYDPRRHTRLT